MKILHVDYGRTMAGGQWQVLYLLERMNEIGEHYSAKLAVASSALCEKARERHVDVRMGAFEENWPWADFIHAHDARAHSFAAWFNRVPRSRKPTFLEKDMVSMPKPLIVSRRVGFPVKKGFFSRWKYKQPNRYLAVSRYVENELMKAGVDGERIRVVYDGVPVPGRPSTLEPGRVVALASKPVEIPGIPIHLTMDLWHDLSTASVFVYRSEMEGLGSAALAAMAAGIPVVASKVGGLPEAVEHERTGLLVENDDFGPAVRRLLQNPQEAEEMGRRGRERVENNFTIDIMVQKTMAAYEEVLHCRK